MKYKIILIMLLSLLIINIAVASDNELYIFKVGDEEIYIQPVIGDNELNVFYISPSIPIGVTPATNVTNISSAGHVPGKIYEKIDVEVISRKNVPGGYVIAEINITNRRNYPITDVVITSYLSNINGDIYSETRTLIAALEVGVTSFHQNLSIPQEIDPGGYKFNAKYEKLTFSREGMKVMFRTDAFDLFEIGRGVTTPMIITIIITILGLTGLIIFMYFFNKRIQKVERILVPVDDDEKEEEKPKKKTRRKPSPSVKRGKFKRS